MALNRQHIEELRALIEKRREALLAELHEDAERAREAPYSEHAGSVTDAGDQSVAALMADLSQADLNRDLDEVRALEAALERIKQGRYGTCEDCGGDVGLERLRAFPGASRCLPCQQRHDKTFAGAKKPARL